MCNNNERLINSCIISGVIIFLVILSGSIFILIFSNSNKIKTDANTDIITIVSIAILSLAFLISVIIVIRKCFIDSFQNETEPDILDEVIVEGNSSL